MIVMKFGGTSVADAAAIRRVVALVRDQLPRRPILVVSAHAGVTDRLLALADAAARGDADAAPIAVRHREILRGLGLDEGLLDPLLDELRDLARGLRLVGAATPKAVDALASFGERLSARTVAAALGAAGIAATAVDASAAGLVTDSAFGRARPRPDDGRLASRLRAVDGVPVVTGFLGADERGDVTTLGRNGSDWSAALVAAAVGAEEIQVWKDVDGVRTADPRLVPDALPIPRMSYADATALAAFGSRVLHPAAMVPAMQRGIPVRVRDVGAPDAAGTTIAADAPVDRPDVHAIAHREPVALVTVTSRRLEPAHAFLAAVFVALDGLGCDVGPVSVGEAAVTVAVDAAVARAAVDRLTEVGEVSTCADCAVVGVVGDPEALERGRAADALAELARGGVRVRCAGLGPRGSTFAVAVDRGDLPDAVRRLHRRFFAS